MIDYSKYNHIEANMPADKIASQKKLEAAVEYLQKEFSCDSIFLVMDVNDKDVVGVIEGEMFKAVTSLANAMFKNEPLLELVTQAMLMAAMAKEAQQKIPTD